MARQLRQADDDFDEACDPPGALDAQAAEPELQSGEVATSDNVELIADVPKQGPFAAETSFNSDIAFQGDYAYAGNDDGFIV